MAARQLPDVYSSRQAEKEHAAVLLKALHFKRSTNENTDITLVCKQGMELRAHRIVLMAASPYIMERADTKADMFDFQTVSVDDMKVILDFVYSAKIPDEDNIKKDKVRLLGVMKGAELLQIPALPKWCRQRLADTINPDNFAEIFALAEDCQNEGMTARSITFVVHNFTHLVRTKSIVKLEVEELKRVLQHPDLVQQCMDDVVRAIFRWVEFDPNRKKHMGSLIHPLDLSYLSKSYLSTLMGSTLMKNDRDLLAVLVGESARRAMNPETNTANICRQGYRLICFGKTDQKRVVTSYDVEADQWLPAEEPPFLFERGMAMVGYGHHVYLFGGGGWPPNPTNSVIEYCPNSNVSSDSVGSLNTPTCRAGAVVCNDYMYIVNGISKDMKRQNIVQRFNARDGTCNLVAPTIYHHFCPLGFTYNYCMYVVGTFNDDEKALECYDPLGDQWTEVTRIPGSIEWCRGAFSGSKLIIIRNKDETKSYIYDLVSGDWTSLEFEIQGPPSNEWGCWAAKKGDRFMLFARWGNNVLHAYDIESMTWVSKSESNKNVWNYLLTCFVWL